MQKNKKELIEEIVEYYTSKNSRICTLLTLQSHSAISPRDFNTYVRSFLKNSELGIYVYSYERGDATGHLHCHIVTSRDLQDKVHSMKKSWFALLKNDELTVDQTFHYEKIGESTWKNVVGYMFKDNVQNLPLKRTVSFAKYGGSAAIKELIKQSIYSACRLSFSYQQEVEKTEELPSPVDNTIPEYNDVRLKAQKLYTLYHEDSKDLFEKQVKIEYEYYSCEMDSFDLPSFVETLSDSKWAIRGAHFKNLFDLITILYNKPKVLAMLRDYVSKYILSISRSNNKKYENVLCALFKYTKEGRTLLISDKDLMHKIYNIVFKILRSDGRSLLYIYEQLGGLAIACQDEQSFGSFDQNEKIHLGHIIYGIFMCLFVPSVQKIISLRDERYIVDPDEVDFNLPFESGDLTNRLRLTVSYEQDEVQRVLPSLNIQKLKGGISFQIPMIVRPKNWVFCEVIRRNNIDYINANLNHSGGFLLNNVVINRPLCKASYFANHVLLINERSLNVLNKMQSISYVLSKELIELYTVNVYRLGGFLSDIKRSGLVKANFSIRETLRELFKEKKTLSAGGLKTVSTKTLYAKCMDSIRKNYGMLDQNTEVLAEDSLLCRLFSGFKCLADEREFFYTYEYDFRMRLYPAPQELSYAGHKFSRSLVKFSQYRKFDATYFKLYAVSQYTNTRNLTECQVLEIFDSKINEILLNYPANIDLFNKAKEPYMLYACAVEWCSYVKSNYSDGYTSNFPVYYDCTSQGPQILSLFFGLRNFSEFLNLCKQQKGSCRGDFYTAVITQFLEDQRKKGWRFIKKDCILDEGFLTFLRGELKNVIMTIFYGVSFQKFSKVIRSVFYKDENISILSTVLILDDRSKVCSEFVQDFWKYTHSLALFQIKPLLSEFSRCLGKESGISWSVFDRSIIKPQYHKVRRHRVDTTVLKSRFQIVVYEKLEEIWHRKQATSFMANFTHSLDAYILNILVERCDFPIMPIHDCFGIHSCNVEKLRKELQNIYSEVLSRGFNYFINQMCVLLEKSVGTAAKNKFLDYTKNSDKIVLGDLSPEDIQGSYNLIVPS